MKQVPLLLLSLLFLSVFSIGAHKQEVFGRSYMFLRPADAHLLAHNFIWLEPVYAQEGNLKGTASANLFFHRTIKQEKNARYFLINGKTELLVAGDNDRLAFMRDVRAEWLNLPSNFAGTLTLQPTQKQAGVIVEYNQKLSKFIPCGLFEHLQVGIRLPVIHVVHNLHLAQKDVRNGGPTSLIDAFNQESWLYGKMVNKQSKTGVGDITLYLDSAFTAEDHTIIAYHSGIVIPAAPEADSEFIFSPQLGNNHRLAVTGGIDFQLLLNRCPVPMAACFFMSLDATYFLRTHRHRTFDLKSVDRQDEGRPWSRFLLFNTPQNPAQRNIPGVNVLTRRAHIRPQGMAEFAVGWRFIYEYCGWEFGYSVWGHDSERIKDIEDDNQTVYGIAAPSASLLDAPQTASTSTIATLGATDATFVPITDKDIHLESGAAGSAINHTFYVGANGNYEGEGFSSYFGANGFVEWPQKNAALMLWGINLKYSAAF